MGNLTQLLFGIHMADRNAFHVQLVWWIILTYCLFAGFYDLKQRRIPNLLSLLALAAVLVIQFAFSLGTQSLLAFAITCVLMLVPTLLQVWGQGDWKMSCVYGAAFGVVPAMGMFLIGFVLATFGRGITTRLSRDTMDDKKAKSVPIATFVAVSTMIFYGITWTTTTYTSGGLL